jgi:hypothetical protein
MNIQQWLLSICVHGALATMFFQWCRCSSLCGQGSVFVLLPNLLSGHGPREVTLFVRYYEPRAWKEKRIKVGWKILRVDLWIVESTIYSQYVRCRLGSDLSSHLAKFMNSNTKLICILLLFMCDTFFFFFLFFWDGSCDSAMCLCGCFNKLHG